MNFLATETTVHSSPEVTDTDLDALRGVMLDVSMKWHEPNDDDSSLRGVSTPGTQRAFDDMSAKYGRRLKAHPDITERFARSTAAEAGSSVFGRYFYAGAFTAARHGLSIDQTRSLMYNPDTYRQLDLITKEKNATAKKIERKNGLIGSLDIIDEEPQRYDIAPNGGLVMVRFVADRRTARWLLWDDGILSEEEANAPVSDKDPSLCKINHRGAFAACYKAMLDISLKDPTLITATLARTDIPNTLTVE